mgnify:CR=1 FL=1
MPDDSTTTAPLPRVFTLELRESEASTLAHVTSIGMAFLMDDPIAALRLITAIKLDANTEDKVNALADDFESLTGKLQILLQKS